MKEEEDNDMKRFACEPEEPAPTPPPTPAPIFTSPSRRNPPVVKRRGAASEWVSRPYWLRSTLEGKRAFAVACGYHHYAVLAATLL